MDKNQKVRDIQNHITELRKELSSITQGSSDLIEEEGREFGEELKNRYRGNMNQMKKRVVEGAQDMQEFAKERPWTLMVAGLVVGFIAGWLVSRKKS